MFCRVCLQFSWSFYNMPSILRDLKVAVPQGKATGTRKKLLVQKTTAKS